MPLHFARSMAGSMQSESLKCAELADPEDMLAMETISGVYFAENLSLLSQCSILQLLFILQCET